jgi:NADPH2 dehydrogenase
MGGSAMIIQEATAVCPEGRISDQDLGLWNDSQASALKDMVRECKKYDTIMAVQLAHAGRKCTVTSENIVAPSAIPFDETSKTPSALTKEEIERVITLFKNAAIRADQAGYDAIEIHAAHGYLLHEFLSPLSNIRTDEYGGSVKNRVRLLREILIEVKKVIPGSMIIGIRISAHDYTEGGLTPEVICELLNEVKEYLDFIHVSSGGLVPAKIHLRPGYQVEFASHIKKLLQLPVIAVGLISEPVQADKIIEEEKADFVALGREILRQPNWPYVAARELNEIVPHPNSYERAWI